MSLSHSIRLMDKFPKVLVSLVDGLSSAEIRFRPESGNWTVLEIVCHLRDEEREDFRPRLRATLADPMLPWLPIDPVAAALNRDYDSQDFDLALAAFVRERQNSLEWLRTLESVDLERAYRHPKLGLIRAGELLVSWAAHDLLHLRQITKRLFEYHRANSFPYSTAYAGAWSES